MFVDHLENQLNNVTSTQNGAKAYGSTLSACLDLFGKIGACREDLVQAKQLFVKAYEENPQLATQILFWVRDVRGGQGERKVFKELLKVLAFIDPQIVQKLIPLVPEFGRWDDLLILEDTSVWDNVLELFKQQLDKDLKAKGKQISLLAKWLPSINASSKDSKRQGRKIANFLGYSEKQYRKTLSTLRSKIKIVEQKMCKSQWGDIEYSKVPSRASFMYRNAFKSHDSQRYTEFLADKEFDKACRENDLTNFEHISSMFEKAGYKLPDLIFWNVNSGSSVPVTVHDSGTALLSDDITPLSVMIESVNSERYLPIKQVFLPLFVKP